MIIIITKTFKKDFKKIFLENNLGIFCKQFSLSKKINLKNPYKKYKIDVSWTAIRWVYIIWFNWIYLPIFIVKKADKKYWMNLILTKELIKILKLKYEKSLKDIENNDFEKYDKNWNLIH